MAGLITGIFFVCINTGHGPIKEAGDWGLKGHFTFFSKISIKLN